MKSGDRVGPFEILALIGAGGMGEVYEARDIRLDRSVALKLICGKLSSDPGAAAEFEREARAVAALSHPNILAIHEFDRDGDLLYAATELLEGSTLRKSMANHRLPWRKAAEIGIALCDGLAAAHAKQIVHRDLKPENIFITKDGMVKILDFGLAVPAARRHVEPDAITDSAPRIAGTAGYMSPEQLRGEPADARSDIFSLGCVLYEMLAGVAPFARGTYVETVAAALHEEAKPLAERGVDAPTVVVRAVERCLEKRKEDRFESVRDLRFALQSAIASWDRQIATSRKNTRLFSALGAILVVAGIGGGVYHGRGPQLPQQPPLMSSLVVLPFENLSHDESQEYFSAGMTDALISNLAQIRSLSVISRTTSVQYKNAKKTVPEIARDLNVEGVVEGTVARSGNRVRITAQLIDAATDRHLWSSVYDEDMTDVLQLQDKLARDIAAQVRARVTPSEQLRLARQRNVAPAAYDTYLKANDASRSFAFERAIAYYQQALVIEPGFAPALAGLAKAYAMASFGSAFNDESWAGVARAAARKSVELDDSSDGHVALALVEWASWNVEAASREIEKALVLSPANAEAHDLYAGYWLWKGSLPRAVQEYERCRDLNPNSGSTWLNLAKTYYAIGDVDAAIKTARKALDLPNGFFTHDGARSVLAKALARRGLYEEAIQNARQTGDENNTYSNLLVIYLTAGKRADADRMVKALEQNGKPMQRASAHALIGENDAAFDDLNEELASRDPDILGIRTDPELASLRSDPRFQQLLTTIATMRPGRRFNFEEYRRTIEARVTLAPNSSEAHEAYGNYLFAAGDQKHGLTELQRACELDPQDHNAWLNLAQAYYSIGDYANAVADANRVLALPDVFFSWDRARWITAKSLARQGKIDQASPLVESLFGDGPRNLGRVLLYTLAGRRPEAQRALQAVDRDDDGFRRAEAHAIIGDNDGALAALRTISPNSYTVLGLLGTQVSPEFSSLRNDPRFDAFLRRIKGRG